MKIVGCTRELRFRPHSIVNRSITLTPELLVSARVGYGERIWRIRFME